MAPVKRIKLLPAILEIAVLSLHYTGTGTGTPTQIRTEIIPSSRGIADV